MWILVVVFLSVFFCPVFPPIRATLGQRGPAGHPLLPPNTLRYAARARRVVNIAVVNEDSTVKIVSELRAQVERLAEEVVKLRAHRQTVSWGVAMGHRPV